MRWHAQTCHMCERHALQPSALKASAREPTHCLARRWMLSDAISAGGRFGLRVASVAMQSFARAPFSDIAHCAVSEAYGGVRGILSLAVCCVNLGVLCGCSCCACGLLVKGHIDVAWISGSGFRNEDDYGAEVVRVIDHICYNGDVHWAWHGEEPGLADRALRLADLSANEDDIKRWVWPKRRPLGEDNVDKIKQRCQTEWLDVDSEITRSSRGENTDEACRRFSDYAEDVLADEGDLGVRRSQIAKPVAYVKWTRSSGEHQTLHERQLRRLRRKLNEYKSHPKDDLLQRTREYSANVNDVPEQLVTTEEYLEWVESNIQEIQDSEKQKRIQNWKEKMSTDIAALAKWIKRAPRISTGDSDPHPAIIGEKCRKELEERWHADRPANVDSQDNYGWASLATTIEIDINGSDVYAAMKRSRCKAPGPDAWRAEDLFRLPQQAFDKIAEIWEAALRVGRLPQVWVNAKMATIPKAGTDERRQSRSASTGSGTSTLTSGWHGWACSTSYAGLSRPTTRCSGGTSRSRRSSCRRPFARRAPSRKVIH